MISFPHAKINLGLSIRSKRADGYHNLETVFYPIQLCDILEIVPSDKHQLFESGHKIEGPSTNNLVWKALEKLTPYLPAEHFLTIYLHKIIPSGAGLGGGSSDAASILRMIKDLFSLPITDQKLINIALELGSDCPFFMQNLPCFASGRGEILEPVFIDLSDFTILLASPTEKVSTAWAFSKISTYSDSPDLKKSIQEPVHQWPGLIFNDFEIPVFEVFPRLKQIKEQFYKAGAIYAAMSGSGSAIFAIFEKNQVPEMSIEDVFLYIVS